ncbi:hypothetical protein PV325_013035 [Microctonus aethiopoides]|nr:hypothetical protein PV325_013035 [Microctonus aethiopoides]KAK0095648.1 hypothetical protein PV326_007769 [Microctonus aethiopoides]KAK0177434.1 hypothetical protein PV328_001487 [Microctonus aethiopoides]
MISAAPLASVHVKFISPPHVYEHALTTNDGNTVAQRYYFAVGQRSSAFYNRPQGFLTFPRVLSRQNAESLWPVGVFLAPVDINDLGYSSQDSFRNTPDFSNGLEHPDPFLLTGEAAVLAVKYLYGHGELFFHEIPHWRALITNQHMRRLNGLHEHVLNSLNPTSPFHKRARH